MNPRNHLSVASIGAIALAVALALVADARGRDALVLRVNDAIGEPGGIVAVTVRTYASRPVGQGQICLGVGGALARSSALVGAPFAELVDFVVFAGRRDAVSTASIEPAGEGQEILLQFSSRSGTINSSDGPLGVLYFRLRRDLRPGQLFELSIDAARSGLFDPAGQPVAITPRSGELEVRGGRDAFKIEVEAGRVEPGGLAEVEIESYEPFAIGRGQISILYDPAIATGRVQVAMSRKQGSRRFRVDRSRPGRILVGFRSPRGDLNLVPGALISLGIPTRSDLPAGRSRVEIDPAESFLLDPAGDPLAVEFEGNGLRFRPSGRGGGGDDDDSDGTDDSGDDDSDGNSDDDDGDSDGAEDQEDDSDGSDDGEDDSDGSDDSEDDSDGDDPEDDSEDDSDGDDSNDD